MEVVDNKLYFLDYAGNRHRVGAVYRRLSDEYLDPFAFNPDSVIGVPGLLSAYRSGNVAIINAPGNGAADDKAIYYFVPQMVRYYLNEEPILHNALTYMPMFEKDRKEVLDRMGELVIKDVAEAGGDGGVFGSSLDKAAREDLADRIKEDPRRFIAQEVIQFRDIDVIDPDSGEVSPRKCDLRAFVVTGQNTHVWYSGLTRYSSVPGQMIVNSSQGGGFKDTWVLAPERAFTTLVQFFPFYDRVMDTDVDAFRPFAKALDLPQDFEDFDGFIHSFLYDGTNPDSVRSAIVAAFNNAVVLRPELTSRLLQYVELAVKNITEAAERSASADDIYSQRDIADDMLAFWGGIENSTADITLKAFVFIGKYIERIDLYTRFHLDNSELDAPLAKLETYSRTLDGMPLPSCFEPPERVPHRLQQPGHHRRPEGRGHAQRDEHGRQASVRGRPPIGA